MAARIPEDKVSELRQSVDIVDIISDYVQLKKQGRNFFGLCPFHHENTPSFSVAPEKQIFHCFGCGAGGNVFNFLMDAENVSFQEAAVLIAGKSGIQLDVEIPEEKADTFYDDEQLEMVKAHELIGKLYHHILMNTAEGEAALTYLKGRGFTEQTIKKFQIGYSLPEWDMAIRYLGGRGFKSDILAKAGLAVEKESGEGYFDRFRNRIMFPLHDAQGKLVAFSARVLAADEQPKYLNTPETPIFHKSSTLYNYYQAKGQIRRQKHAVLFEGFADVIAADRADVPNGIAVMGTSLTEKHIQMLRRLTDTVYLCFDSDKAGSEAAYRAGTMLKKHKMEVKVALLPQGLDPDDYVRMNGADKFQSDIIGNVMTWTAFKLIYHRQGKNLQNEGDRLLYIEEVIQELSDLENPVERDMYTRQIADEFSLSLEVLEDQQEKILHAERKKKRTGQFKREEQRPHVPKKEKHTGHLTAERHLLARMFESEDTAYRIMDMLDNQPLANEEHQAILTYLLGYYSEGNAPEPLAFLDFLPDKKLRSIVAEIQMRSADTEKSEQELKDCVNYVLKHAKMLMIKEKQIEQKQAERSKDMKKALDIAREILELRKSLNL